MPKLEVRGMSCGHCKKSVEDALAKLPGVAEVTVDLDAALAVIKADGQLDSQVAKQAVRDIGFEPGEYAE